MKANSASLPSSNSLRAGFSLVEVVLAVGIMALGVVTILGLLPHGLEMSRKTANEQAETRIVDQIVGELQASEWTTLGGVTGPGNATGILLQFDDQGLRTLEGALTTYIARVRMVDNNETSAGMAVPTNGSGSAFNQNLRRVRIDVAAAQNTDFDFDNPPPAAPVKRFTSLVARMRP